MNDLVEFLRARLGEDERIARAGSGPGGPHWPNVDWEQRSPQLEHARRHDPARVLAEVEAKRKILQEHAPVPVDAVAWSDDQDAPYGCRTCAFSSEEGVRGWGYCPTLRLLALPYADHEDYRPEWRPDA